VMANDTRGGWQPIPKPLPPPPMASNEPVRPNTALRLVEDAERVVRERIRERVVKRLADTLERELREGLPGPPPSPEQVAYALIKSLAHDLQAAGAILERSAKALNSAGKATEANLAMMAAQRAKKAAEDILG
jgi:hypothetical protein